VSREFRRQQLGGEVRAKGIHSSNKGLGGKAWNGCSSIQWLRLPSPRRGFTGWRWSWKFTRKVGFEGAGRRGRAMSVQKVSKMHTQTKDEQREEILIQSLRCYLLEDPRNGISKKIYIL